MVDEPDEKRESVFTTSRRSALKLAGGAGGVALLSTGSVGGATDGTEARTEDSPPGSMSDPQLQTEESDQPVGTDALFSFIEAKYGDRLSEDQLGEVEENVAGNLRTAKTLDEVPLENGDGPAFAFEVYRGDD